MMTYETTTYLLIGLLVQLAVGFGGIAYFARQNARIEAEVRRVDERLEEGRY